MITLKRLNVVRQVSSEEKAKKLESLGFTRISAAGKGKAASKGKQAEKDKAAGKDKEVQNGGSNQPDHSNGAE